MSPLRKKTPRRKLSESAYDLIRADIVRCRLEPGSEVTEASLAKRYRMGKAPIRAALQRLAQEGLVRSRPRRGHQVAPITLKDIHDLFEMRLLLEPATAAKAATRITDAQVEELRRVSEEDLAQSTQQAVIYGTSDTQFHVMIARVAGNARMTEAIAHLHDQLERVINLRMAIEPTQRALNDTIVEALANRDAEAAERAARAHVEFGMRLILDAIHKSESLLTVELGRT